MKILIAEDESLIRLGLKALLTQLGHDVVTAVDGREAVQFARTARPDLAILDIHMPHADGLEVARTLARKHPMPIIMLTAFSDQPLLQQAADLPIQGYLLKPVNERDLAAAIHIAVARFRDAQAAAREIAELKADIETRKLVEKAKGVLMRQDNLTENEAYLALQKRARDTQTSMREAALKVVGSG